MVPDIKKDLYETLTYDIDDSIQRLKSSTALGIISASGYAPLILATIFNASSGPFVFATVTASLGTLTGISALKAGKSCLRDFRETREEMLAMEQQYPELKEFSPFKEATPR